MGKPVCELIIETCPGSDNVSDCAYISVREIEVAAGTKWGHHRSRNGYVVRQTSIQFHELEALMQRLAV